MQTILQIDEVSLFPERLTRVLDEKLLSSLHSALYPSFSNFTSEPLKQQIEKLKQNLIGEKQYFTAYSILDYRKSVKLQFSKSLSSLSNALLKQCLNKIELNSDSFNKNSEVIEIQLFHNENNQYYIICIYMSVKIVPGFRLFWVPLTQSKVEFNYYAAKIFVLNLNLLLLLK